MRLRDVELLTERDQQLAFGFSHLFPTRGSWCRLDDDAVARGSITLTRTGWSRTMPRTPQVKQSITRSANWRTRHVLSDCRLSRRRYRSSNTSIVVPRGGCNLVVHDQGSSPKQDVDRGLKIFDLTDYLGKGAASGLEYLQSKVPGPLDIWTLSDLISDAVSMGVGKNNKRLIAIASNAVGTRSLKVAGKLLDVVVRDRRTVTLSFWYYQYNGSEEEKLEKWREMGGGLDRNTHSRYAILQANKYFVPQANIAFELKAAKDVPTGDFPQTTSNNPKDLTYPAFDHDSGIKMANDNPDSSGADFRVFIVPTVGGGAGAFELPPDVLQTTRAVFVPWIYFARSRKPNSSNPNADLFVPELCHELVHALSGGTEHSDRANVMCNTHDHSTLEDELLIDAITLETINNPLRK